MQAIHTHTFDNGLVLLGETMDWLESAAFAILVPAGYIYDPPDQLGLSNFASEMVQRGCGDRDSRQFVEDLDRLGVDRSASVSSAHTSFGGASLAENLIDSLAIYADLVLAPHLPAEQLEEGRHVCLQELWSSEDDLARRTMLRLKQRHYGDPWGRSSQGVEEDLQRIGLEQIQQYIRSRYRPSGAIISVAGSFSWSQVRDEIERLFDRWPQVNSEAYQEASPVGGYEHVEFESSQTQIGIAYNSVPYAHPDYFRSRAAVGVLSDGMSSRLFTEVREKRGLCYSVYATCHSLLDRGSVLCYAGTSTDRAQETLDVLVSQLRTIHDGVDADELSRLKARLKSSIIMQQESSASRSTSMAADWYHLERVMTMQELGGIIDGLSCETINQYLSEHVPDQFTHVTLGEKKLEVPVGIS